MEIGNTCTIYLSREHTSRTVYKGEYDGVFEGMLCFKDCFYIDEDNPKPSYMLFNKRHIVKIEAV